MPYRNFVIFHLSLSRAHVVGFIRDYRDMGIVSIMRCQYSYSNIRISTKIRLLGLKGLSRSCMCWKKKRCMVVEVTITLLFEARLVISVVGDNFSRNFSTAVISVNLTRFPEISRNFLGNLSQIFGNFTENSRHIILHPTIQCTHPLPQVQVYCPRDGTKIVINLHTFSGVFPTFHWSK